MILNQIATRPAGCLLLAALTLSVTGASVAGASVARADSTTTVPPTTIVAPLPSTTATTRPTPISTTTSVPPSVSTSTTVGSTTAPPTTAPATARTTAATTTKVDPGAVTDLLQSLNRDLARASVLSSYLAARTAAAQMATGYPGPATADPALIAAAAAELGTSGSKQAAGRQRDVARRHLSGLAIALYLDAGAPVDSPMTSAVGGGANRSVYLAMLLSEQRAAWRAASRGFANASAAFDHAKAHADQLVAERTAALAATALATSAPVPPGTATTTRPSHRPASGAKKGALLPRSPAILGPTTLTAAEVVGWFNSTGHRADLTVPLPALVNDYEMIGAFDGVRADIAFAQSIVETGYFEFPAGGQLSPSDNNFAGIGACDSCRTGWHFSDAQTGVAGQLQLLHAYASTKSVPGPLTGPIGVSNCCPTWMALTGVWATASDYGYVILRTYRQMLEWALTRRSGAAGL